MFEQLTASARVTVVSAAAGSGKTVLLRSWIAEMGLAESTAWVAVGRGARDPQRFWLSIVCALRETGTGSGLVQAVTAAPDLDEWVIVERLLTELASLPDPIWLVIDDVHELGPDRVLRQLELMILRAPPQLRFVLLTRHDLRLGLHRLRLEGELTEIRGSDLRFTVDEARGLFSTAGLTSSVLEQLVERTEGWAAGLRLAALSLARHPNPARVAAEFCGSERTVTEYLLVEVLDQQSEQVRRLLLRTSILERVNGELADLLTRDSGGERALQDLVAANAFVVAVDTARSWFRYHHLFADLLQLQLRREAPDDVTALHLAAAGWLAGNGYPVEAIRHAQAAQDWELAARLLTDHWPALHLDGQDATVRQLLAGFPTELRYADAELAAVAVADELAYGSLAAVEQHLGVAERAMRSVRDARRAQTRLLLAIARLLLARGRGDLPAVAEATRQLEATANAPDSPQPALGEDLHALALISLGIAESSTDKFADAAQHLEQGVALARRIGRPYLECTGLAYQALTAMHLVSPRAVEYGSQAVELAEQHGWADEPAAGIASMILGMILVWRGRLAEAEPWIQRAERAVRAETEPAVAMALYNLRGTLELARGRDAEALVALKVAERLAGLLAQPAHFAPRARALIVHALARLGETEQAEQVLAEFDEHDRDRVERRVAMAVLWLAEDDPQGAIAVLMPVLDGSTPVAWSTWLAQAFLLDAIARDTLGDQRAADRSLEHALDLAEPNGALGWFLLHPVSCLLDRQTPHRGNHAALRAEIQSVLAGRGLVRSSAGPRPPLEALSNAEIRVLRYLPTNLSAAEIARELSISHSTVKTHRRNLYVKLGTHGRAETVERARALGLLAPSASQSPVIIPS